MWQFFVTHRSIWSRSPKTITSHNWSVLVRKPLIHLTQLWHTSPVSKELYDLYEATAAHLNITCHLYTISPLIRDSMHVFTSQPALLGEPLQIYSLPIVCLHPSIHLLQFNIWECHLLPEMEREELIQSKATLEQYAWIHWLSTASSPQTSLHFHPC